MDLFKQVFKKILHVKNDPFKESIRKNILLIINYMVYIQVSFCVLNFLWSTSFVGEAATIF